MTDETKRDDFKEIEEMIRKLVERSLSARGGTFPSEFRIIISGGEITDGHSPITSPISQQVIEPSIEVYSEENEVRVLAEVPGADLSTTHLQVTGRVLRIYADGGECRYHTTVELPPVEAESMSALLTHGILEVTFKKSPLPLDTP
ncbi:MAG: Hsp20/alpha crystallin family protein [Methanomicrobiales archaeon]|nr:Hsp20/alpha crystallin family protein [Methanomicrobiales archaeon]